jgi:hypothetical protein
MIAEHMAAGQSSSESPEEASDGSRATAVREQVVALLEESGFQRYNQVRVRSCWSVCSMCVVHTAAHHSRVPPHPVHLASSPRAGPHPPLRPPPPPPPTTTTTTIRRWRRKGVGGRCVMA